MYGDAAWSARHRKIIARRDQFRAWYGPGMYIAICTRTGAHVCVPVTADTQGGQVTALGKFERTYGLSPYREYLCYTT